MKNTIEILRGLREDKDLKQSDIANLIGTTQQQYSKYETGESELPLRALSILADHYHVSADYLMGRTDSREGIAALNKKIIDNITAGSLLSDVISLSAVGKRAVLEYIFLQKLKQRYEVRGKMPKKGPKYKDGILQEIMVNLPANQIRKQQSSRS